MLHQRKELLAAYKACTHFHPIIYGCDIIIRCDHMKITHTETQHANLCVLCQLIALNQVYQAKLEHIAGTSNTGADGLSKLDMCDSIPNTLVQEVYTINELDHEDNIDFPLSLEKSDKNKTLMKSFKASSN